MQQGDYSSYYQFPHLPNSNPNPNPTDFPQPPYASAPPFNSGYSSNDYPNYQPNYPPYPHNSDPAPPTAPTYNPPLSTTPPASNPSPLASFNPPPPSSAPSFPPYESPHGGYQPPTSQPPYFQSYDQHQTASAYAPPPPNPEATPQPPFYSASYSHPGSFDNQYDNSNNSMKFDHGGGYFDDKYGGYNRSRSDLGSDPYGKRSESYSGFGDDGYGDGVYAYQGPKVEPYGARGTAPKSSSSAMFDDYGRPVGVSSGKDSSFGSAVSSPKIVRAVPKADAQQDVKSGVQKFRVKLLPESYGQNTMDVLCQIGLDGIRMLDPSTNRTLRIYSLESVTRCEVTDSSTLAFWSKSSVDIEPRRIRLQSSSYTTNTLLDIITAATVQIKEMGGRSRPSETMKTADQTAEKKKGLTDWMNIIKPANEEKDHWVPDEAVTKCTGCGSDFGAFLRKHHCRNCGDIFCDKCTQGRIALTAEDNAQPVRVCDRCMAEVTQRLSRAKEASKPGNLQSHEDLAKKLQEEMEKNRRASSGSKTDGSGRRMKEVECPTCTVHLQVQVPSSGSETIECGVCQHPFLVSAH